MVSKWAVVFLGVCIVLAAFLMQGRYRVISGSGSRIYVVDQFTGSTRLCLPDGCRRLVERVSVKPLADQPIRRSTATEQPAAGDGWVPVTDPDILRQLDSAN